MAVEYKGRTEVLVNGGTSITMQIPTGANGGTAAAAGDLLIAYIAKDDNVAIYTNGDYSKWNMLCNVISDSQTCLYVAWRIATADDVSGVVSWTWNADSEDWVGEILCYSGADTTTPIPFYGSDYLDSSATPTAPSVEFSGLEAGSLCFQCFGCDFDDTPRVVPSILTSRFNQHQAADIGGAGGDKGESDGWLSPTGHNDPDTKWTDEASAYDEDTGTFTYHNILAESWGSYLELTCIPVECSKVRFWAKYVSSTINQISLDVYYSSDWHNIYEGAFATNEWVEKEIGSSQNVTAMRMKFYNTHVSQQQAQVKEADFYTYATTMSGDGFTGTAVFGIPSSNEWTAFTAVIEAASAAGEFYKSIAGAFSATGAVVKLPKISLAGVLSSTGSLVRKTLLSLAGNFDLTGIVSSIFKFPKSLAGAFGLTGTVVKLPKINLSGVFNFAGSIVKLPKIILSGILSPTGVVSSIWKSFQSLAGTFGLIGNIVKLPKISLSGAFNFTGNIARKILLSLSGVFTSTGTIGSVLTKFKSLSGVFDLTGSLGRKIYYSLAGVFSSTGSIVGIKKIFKSLAGVFTFTGTVGKLIKKGLSGAFDFVGSGVGQLLGGIFYKSLAGAFDFSGGIGRKISKSLAGVFNLTGTITSILTKFKSLAGTFTLTGTIVKLPKILLSGVLTSTGTITGIFVKLLSGSFDFTGSLGRLTKKALSGILTSTGSVGTIKKIFKAISGAFDFTGFAEKLPKINLSGTFNFSGSLGRLIKKSLSGAFSFLGSGVGQLLGGIFYKSLSGAFGLTGIIVKLPKINLSGVFGLTGSISTIKRFFKALAGVFSSTGSIGKLIKKTLSGVFTLIGYLRFKTFWNKVIKETTEWAKVAKEQSWFVMGWFTEWFGRIWGSTNKTVDDWTKTSKDTEDWTKVSKEKDDWDKVDK